MNKNKLHKSRLLFKTLSLILAAAFCLENIAGAAPDAGAVSALLFKKQLPEFGFSNSVAYVEDAWKGPSARTVILIQDAHTNPSAQKNISKALAHILDITRAKYVFIEAGTGNDSLSFLRAAAPEKDRRQIAESYLRRGLLGGEEYLDLTDRRSFTIWGVENKDLYWKSVENYKKIRARREDFQSYLAKIKQTVRTLKPRIYSPDLLALDAAREEYRDGKIPFTSYFDILSREAERQGIPLRYYPHLQGLGNLRQAEAAIDFDKVNREQAEALSHLSPDDLEPLNEAGRNRAFRPFKVGRREHREEKAFYALLEEAAGSLSAYPELSKYIAYLKTAGKIDPAELLKEQKQLETALFEGLLRTDDERSLEASGEGLRYLEKLLHLTLTPEEFEAYRSDPKAFEMARITGFLNHKIMDLGDLYGRAAFLHEDFEAYAAMAETFYRLTLDRDKAFTDNLLQKMGKERQETTVLIAGGYHAPNLKSLLKSKGISFVSVVPQVFHETNLKRYETLLLNQLKDKNVPAAPASLPTRLIDTRPMLESPFLAPFEAQLGYDRRAAAPLENEGAGARLAAVDDLRIALYRDFPGVAEELSADQLQKLLNEKKLNHKSVKRILGGIQTSRKQRNEIVRTVRQHKISSIDVLKKKYKFWIAAGLLLAGGLGLWLAVPALFEKDRARETSRSAAPAPDNSVRSAEDFEKLFKLPELEVLSTLAEELESRDRFKYAASVKTMVNEFRRRVERDGRFAEFARHNPFPALTRLEKADGPVLFVMNLSFLKENLEAVRKFYRSRPDLAEDILTFLKSILVKEAVHYRDAEPFRVSVRALEKFAEDGPKLSSEDLKTLILSTVALKLHEEVSASVDEAAYLYSKGWTGGEYAEISRRTGGLIKEIMDQLEFDYRSTSLQDVALRREDALRAFKSTIFSRMYLTGPIFEGDSHFSRMLRRIVGWEIDAGNVRMKGDLPLPVNGNAYRFIFDKELYSGDALKPFLKAPAPPKSGARLAKDNERKPRELSSLLSGLEIPGLRSQLKQDEIAQNARAALEFFRAFEAATRGILSKRGRAPSDSFNRFSEMGVLLGLLVEGAQQDPALSFLRGDGWVLYAYLISRQRRFLDAYLREIDRYPMESFDKPDEYFDYKNRLRHLLKSYKDLEETLLKVLRPAEKTLHDDLLHIQNLTDLRERMKELRVGETLLPIAMANGWEVKFSYEGKTHPPRFAYVKGRTLSSELPGGVEHPVNPTSYDGILKNSSLLLYENQPHPFSKILKEGIEASAEPFVWADVGPGLGLALREAKRRHGPEIRTYGADVVDWSKAYFSGSLSAPAGWSRRDWHLFDEVYNYDFVPGSMEAVRFPESPDLITAFYSMPYAEDPIAAIANFYNQLKPGGQFIGSLFRYLLPSPEDEPLRQGLYHDDWIYLLVEGMKAAGIEADVSGDVLRFRRLDEREMTIGLVQKSTPIRDGDDRVHQKYIRKSAESPVVSLRSGARLAEDSTLPSAEETFRVFRGVSYDRAAELLAPVFGELKQKDHTSDKREVMMVLQYDSMGGILFAAIGPRRPSPASPERGHRDLAKLARISGDYFSASLKFNPETGKIDEPYVTYFLANKFPSAHKKTLRLMNDIRKRLLAEARPVKKRFEGSLWGMVKRLFYGTFLVLALVFPTGCGTVRSTAWSAFGGSKDPDTERGRSGVKKGFWHYAQPVLKTAILAAGIYYETKQIKRLERSGPAGEEFAANLSRGLYFDLAFNSLYAGIGSLREGERDVVSLYDDMLSGAFGGGLKAHAKRKFIDHLDRSPWYGFADSSVYDLGESIVENVRDGRPPLESYRKNFGLVTLQIGLGPDSRDKLWLYPTSLIYAGWRFADDDFFVNRRDWIRASRPVFHANPGTLKDGLLAQADAGTVSLLMPIEGDFDPTTMSLRDFYLKKGDSRLPAFAHAALEAWSLNDSKYDFLGSEVQKILVEDAGFLPKFLRIDEDFTYWLREGTDWYEEDIKGKDPENGILHREFKDWEDFADFRQGARLASEDNYDRWLLLQSGNHPDADKTKVLSLSLAVHWSLLKIFLKRGAQEWMDSYQAIRQLRSELSESQVYLENIVRYGIPQLIDRHLSFRGPSVRFGYDLAAYKNQLLRFLDDLEAEDATNAFVYYDDFSPAFLNDFIDRMIFGGTDYEIQFENPVFWNGKAAEDTGYFTLDDHVEENRRRSRQKRSEDEIRGEVRDLLAAAQRGSPQRGPSLSNNEIMLLTRNLLAYPPDQVLYYLKALTEAVQSAAEDRSSISSYVVERLYRELPSREAFDRYEASFHHNVDAAESPEDLKEEIVSAAGELRFELNDYVRKPEEGEANFERDFLELFQSLAESIRKMPEMQNGNVVMRVNRLLRRVISWAQKHPRFTVTGHLKHHPDFLKSLSVLKSRYVLSPSELNRLREEDPELTFTYLLYRNLLDGRVPVVASDLKGTLATFTEKTGHTYPKIRKAVREALQEGKVYVVTGDTEQLVLNKFLLPNKWVSFENDITFPEEEEVKNLVWLTKTGMDQYEYREDLGRFEGSTLVPGIRNEDREKLEEMAEAVSLQHELADRYSTENGYHREVHIAIDRVMPPGFLEIRPSVSGKGFSAAFHLAGSLNRASREVFEQDPENRRFLMKLADAFQTELEKKKLTYIHAGKGGLTTIDFVTTDKGMALEALQAKDLKPNEYFVFFGDQLFEGGNDHAALRVARIGVDVGKRRDYASEYSEDHLLLFSQTPAEEGGTGWYIETVTDTRRLARVFGLRETKTGARLSAGDSQDKSIIRNFTGLQYRRLSKMSLVVDGVKHGGPREGHPVFVKINGDEDTAKREILMLERIKTDPYLESLLHDFYDGTVTEADIEHILTLNAGSKALTKRAIEQATEKEDMLTQKGNEPTDEESVIEVNETPVQSVGDLMDRNRSEWELRPGLSWIGTERAKGTSIDDVLELIRDKVNQKVYSAGDDREVLHTLRDIVDAVIVMHEQGLYHRDLGSSEVFRRDGVVEFVDFGLASFSAFNDDGREQELPFTDEDGKDLSLAALDIADMIKGDYQRNYFTRNLVSPETHSSFRDLLGVHFIMGDFGMVLPESSPIQDYLLKKLDRFVVVDREKLLKDEIAKAAAKPFSTAAPYLVDLDMELALLLKEYTDEDSASEAALVGEIDRYVEGNRIKPESMVIVFRKMLNYYLMTKSSGWMRTGQKPTEKTLRRAMSLVAQLKALKPSGFPWPEELEDLDNFDNLVGRQIETIYRQKIDTDASEGDATLGALTRYMECIAELWWVERRFEEQKPVRETDYDVRFPGETPWADTVSVSVPPIKMFGILPVNKARKVSATAISGHILFWDGRKSILARASKDKKGRYEVRSIRTDLAEGARLSSNRETAEKYERLERFVAGHLIGRYWPSDESVYLPTPMPAIYRGLTDLDGRMGGLRGKKLIDVGAGDLRVSLAAASLFGMDVTAVEKDRFLSGEGQKILNEAQRFGLIENGSVRLVKETDALDIPWDDFDAVLFFYTAPHSKEKLIPLKLQEKVLEELKDTAYLGLFLTGGQIMAGVAELPMLKPVFRRPGESSLALNGVYFQLYRNPIGARLAADSPTPENLLRELESLTRYLKFSTQASDARSGKNIQIEFRPETEKNQHRVRLRFVLTHPDAAVQSMLRRMYVTMSNAEPGRDYRDTVRYEAVVNERGEAVFDNVRPGGDYHLHFRYRHGIGNGNFVYQALQERLDNDEGLEVIAPLYLAVERKNLMRLAASTDEAAGLVYGSVWAGEARSKAPEGVKLRIHAAEDPGLDYEVYSAIETVDHERRYVLRVVPAGGRLAEFDIERMIAPEWLDSLRSSSWLPSGKGIRIRKSLNVAGLISVGPDGKAESVERRGSAGEIEKALAGLDPEDYVYLTVSEADPEKREVRYRLLVVQKQALQDKERGFLWTTATELSHVFDVSHGPGDILFMVEFKVDLNASLIDLGTVALHRSLRSNGLSSFFRGDGKDRVYRFIKKKFGGRDFKVKTIATHTVTDKLFQRHFKDIHVIKHEGTPDDPEDLSVLYIAEIPPLSGARLAETAGDRLDPALGVHLGPRVFLVHPILLKFLEEIGYYREGRRDGLINLEYYEFLEHLKKQDNKLYGRLEDKTLDVRTGVKSLNRFLAGEEKNILLVLENSITNKGVREKKFREMALVSAIYGLEKDDLDFVRFLLNLFMEEPHDSVADVWRTAVETAREGGSIVSAEFTEHLMRMAPRVEADAARIFQKIRSNYGDYSRKYGLEGARLAEQREDDSVSRAPADEKKLIFDPIDYFDPNRDRTVDGIQLGIHLDGRKADTISVRIVAPGQPILREVLFDRIVEELPAGSETIRPSKYSGPLIIDNLHLGRSIIIGDSIHKNRNHVITFAENRPGAVVLNVKRPAALGSRLAEDRREDSHVKLQSQGTPMVPELKRRLADVRKRLAVKEQELEEARRASLRSMLLNAPTVFAYVVLGTSLGGLVAKAGYPGTWPSIIFLMSFLTGAGWMIWKTGPDEREYQRLRKETDALSIESQDIHHAIFRQATSGPVEPLSALVAGSFKTISPDSKRILNGRSEKLVARLRRFEEVRSWSWPAFGSARQQNFIDTSRRVDRLAVDLVADIAEAVEIGERSGIDLVLAKDVTRLEEAVGDFIHRSQTGFSAAKPAQGARLSDKITVSTVDLQTQDEAANRRLLRGMIAVNDDSGWDLSKESDDLKTEFLNRSRYDGTVVAARDRDGNLAGYAWVRPGGLNEVNWYLTAVRKKYHSKGIGRQLKEAVFAALAKRDIHRISLTIQASNRDSIRFFDRIIASGEAKIREMVLSFPEKEYTADDEDILIWPFVNQTSGSLKRSSDLGDGILNIVVELLAPSRRDRQGETNPDELHRFSYMGIDFEYHITSQLTQMDPHFRVTNEMIEKGLKEYVERYKRNPATIWRIVNAKGLNKFKMGGDGAVMLMSIDGRSDDKRTIEFSIHEIEPQYLFQLSFVVGKMTFRMINLGPQGARLAELSPDDSRWAETLRTQMRRIEENVEKPPFDVDVLEYDSRIDEAGTALELWIFTSGPKYPETAAVLTDIFKNIRSEQSWYQSLRKIAFIEDTIRHLSEDPLSGARLAEKMKYPDPRRTDLALDPFDHEHFFWDAQTRYWRSRHFPRLVIGTPEDIRHEEGSAATAMENHVVMPLKNGFSIYVFDDDKYSPMYLEEARRRPEWPKNQKRMTEIFMDLHDDAQSPKHHDTASLQTLDDWYRYTEKELNHYDFLPIMAQSGQVSDILWLQDRAFGRREHKWLAFTMGHEFSPAVPDGDDPLKIYLPGRFSVINIDLSRYGLYGERPQNTSVVLVTDTDVADALEDIETYYRQLAQDGVRPATLLISTTVPSPTDIRTDGYGKLEWARRLAETAPQVFAGARLSDASADDLSNLIEGLYSPVIEQRRSAACAIGQKGVSGVKAVPSLMKLLDDPEKEVRKASAKALGQIGEPAIVAVRKLARTATEDTDVQVQELAAEALINIDPNGEFWDIALGIFKKKKERDSGSKTGARLAEKGDVEWVFKKVHDMLMAGSLRRIQYISVNGLNYNMIGLRQGRKVKVEAAAERLRALLKNLARADESSRHKFGLDVEEGLRPDKIYAVYEGPIRIDEAEFWGINIRTAGPSAGQDAGARLASAEERIREIFVQTGIALTKDELQSFIDYAKLVNLDFGSTEQYLRLMGKTPVSEDAVDSLRLLISLYSKSDDALTVLIGSPVPVKAGDLKGVPAELAPSVEAAYGAIMSLRDVERLGEEVPTRMTIDSFVLVLNYAVQLVMARRYARARNQFEGLKRAVDRYEKSTKPGLDDFRQRLVETLLSSTSKQIEEAIARLPKGAEGARLSAERDKDAGEVVIQLLRQTLEITQLQNQSRSIIAEVADEIRIKKVRQRILEQKQAIEERLLELDPERAEKFEQKYNELYELMEEENEFMALVQSDLGTQKNSWALELEKMRESMRSLGTADMFNEQTTRMIAMNSDFIKTQRTQIRTAQTLLRLIREISAMLEGLDEASGPSSAEGERGARLAETKIKEAIGQKDATKISHEKWQEKLSGFFLGLAYAQPVSVLDGGKLALLLEEDPVIFNLSYKEGSLTAETEDGIVIELSRSDLKNGGRSPKKLEDALTLQDLRLMVDTVNQKVSQNLSQVTISSEKPLVLEVNLDILPDANSRGYLDYLLAELKALENQPWARNLFMTVKGQNALFVNEAVATGLFHEEEGLPEGARVVKLSPARLGVFKGFINVPVGSLKEGDVPAFGAIVRLAVYSGRIDLDQMPDPFVSAYETLSAENIDTQILKDILEGRADVQIVSKFALKPLTKVALNKAIQLFRNMVKMIGQAA